MEQPTSEALDSVIHLPGNTPVPPIDFTSGTQAEDHFIQSDGIEFAGSHLIIDLWGPCHPGGSWWSCPFPVFVPSVVRLAEGDYLWYYLDHAIYGSYSGQVFDYVLYPLQIFENYPHRYPSILLGPTCDSIDIIAEDIDLLDPGEGDFQTGHMMGAYTAATSTRFNSLLAVNIVIED